MSGQPFRIIFYGIDVTINPDGTHKGDLSALEAALTSKRTNAGATGKVVAVLEARLAVWRSNQ